MDPNVATSLAYPSRYAEPTSVGWLLSEMSMTSTPDMWLATSASFPATSTFFAWPGVLNCEMATGAAGFETSTIPRPEWPVAA